MATDDRAGRSFLRDDTPCRAQADLGRIIRPRGFGRCVRRTWCVETMRARAGSGCHGPLAVRRSRSRRKRAGAARGRVAWRGSGGGRATLACSAMSGAPTQCRARDELNLTTDIGASRARPRVSLARNAPARRLPRGGAGLDGLARTARTSGGSRRRRDQMVPVRGHPAPMIASAADPKGFVWASASARGAGSPGR